MLVSESGNSSASDFTPTGLTVTLDDNEWHEYTVDLSAYSGMGYVAIRHYDCEDQHLLYVDDVTIVGKSAEWTTVTGATSPCTLTNLKPNTQYVARVKELNGEGGESAWSDNVTFTTLDVLDLANNQDNSTLINDNNGESKNVMLAGRTLWQDNAWNTLCLPFNVTVAGSPLAGADVRTLTSASFSDGSLTLNFTGENAVTELTAGTPYIIKWASGDNIVNPVFTGVTIDKTMRDVPCELGDGKSVTFKGTYGYTSFTDDDQSILFMGEGNTLYYPKNGASIGAQRAFFELGGITAGAAKSLIKEFVLTFGEDADGIKNLNVDDNLNETIYNLAGQRLGKTQKGINIVNGKKVIIK